MNKRKELAALLKSEPLLHDYVSSLEAQISTLSSQHSVLNQDWEDLIEENDEMADTILKQVSELREAHANYASLNSRYQQLLKICAALTKQTNKNDQEE